MAWHALRLSCRLRGAADVHSSKSACLAINCSRAAESVPAGKAWACCSTHCSEFARHRCSMCLGLLRCSCPVFILAH